MKKKEERRAAHNTSEDICKEGNRQCRKHRSCERGGGGGESLCAAPREIGEGSAPS